MEKIALLYGGFSGEAEVSKKSAEEIFKALQKKHQVFLVKITDWQWEVHDGDQLIPMDKNNFTFQFEGEQQHFDRVFNIIHGTPGEDGKLSAYFELLGLPYNSSGVLASALTFNKNWCNRFLSTYGITVPQSLVFYKGEEVSDQLRNVSFPCFVKPNNGGSSIGTHKVKNLTELEAALADAFVHDSEVIVEEFIEGREFSCGIFKSPKGLEVMPPTEIIPLSEFFDYKQKYSEDGAKEVTPAELSPEQTSQMQAVVERVFKILRLKRVARIDFILKGDQFYLIEVNTIPGMSPRSLLPQQAKCVGYSFEELVEILI